MSEFKAGDRVRVIADEETLIYRFLSGEQEGVEGVVIKIVSPPSNYNGVECPYRIETEDDVFKLAAQDLELVEPVVLATTEGEPWGGGEPPERTFVGHPEGVLEVISEPGIGKTPIPVLDQKDVTALPGCPIPFTRIRTFDSGATRDTAQGKLDYIKALSPIVLRRYVQYLDKHRLQADGSYRDFDNWKKGIPEAAYISGNGRHFMDTWLLTEGYATEDNHGPVELEDAICAQLFNLMGRLHEILGKKVDRTAPVLTRADANDTQCKNTCANYTGDGKSNCAVEYHSTKQSGDYGQVNQCNDWDAKTDRTAPTEGGY